MDFQIRCGDDLVCPFTGVPVKVLIRAFIPGEGEKVEEVSTGWLSSEILQKCLWMLSASEGRPQQYPEMIRSAPIPLAPVPSHFQEPPPVMSSVDERMIPEFRQTPAPVAAKKKPAISREEAECVRNFAQELAEMAENPPLDEFGKKAGLSEIHIKKLINDFKDSVSDPWLLYPILQEQLGFPKMRFELLVGKRK